VRRISYVLSPSGVDMSMIGAGRGGLGDCRQQLQRSLRHNDATHVTMVAMVRDA
jgi:hypothetical protein